MTTTQNIKFIDTDITMENLKESTPSAQDQDSTYNPKGILSNFFESHTDSNRDVESENGLQEIDIPTEEHETITETIKKTPGRYKKILTGKPSRPRKLHQLL